MRWHRAGFRCYWRWKSRPRGGRPQIDTELRTLISRMSIENPLWGAPRIHGELLKLGFEVAQSSVAKYIVKPRGRPARDGGPSCVTTRRASPLWTCSLFQLSVSTCSMLWSSSVSAAGAHLDQRHSKSHGRMGCASNHGGIPLERGSALHDPGPGSHLRCGRHTPTACHGHPRQAYRTSFALAEWFCRTADRIDPA